MKTDAVPRSPLRRRLLAGLAGAALLPRSGFGANDHLVGEHLRFIIPSPVGNGTDIVGRAFARHAQRLLPRTDVTVENMDSASGRVAEKTVWESGPDGLTVCFMRGSMTYRVLLNPHEHPYGFDDFTWLGSMSRDRLVLVARAAGELDTLEALLAADRPVLAPADNVESERFKMSAMLNYLTGSRILPVPGYSNSDSKLALIGGEVEVITGSFESIYSLLQSGDAKLLLRIADLPLPAPYDRVPTLSDLTIDPARRWLLQMLKLQSNLGRPVAAAPDLPPDRADRLRRLFIQVVSDPLFLEEVKALGFAIQPLGGAEAQADIEEITASMAGRVDELKAVFACGLRRAETGESCAA